MFLRLRSNKARVRSVPRDDDDDETDVHVFVNVNVHVVNVRGAAFSRPWFVLTSVRFVLVVVPPR